MELAQVLAAAAKQYGAPVAKDIGVKVAIAGKAHQAVLAAETEGAAAASEAARVARPRAEWEAKVRECGRLAQVLSRKRAEARS